MRALALLLAAAAVLAGCSGAAPPDGEPGTAPDGTGPAPSNPDSPAWQAALAWRAEPGQAPVGFAEAGSAVQAGAAVMVGGFTPAGGGAPTTLRYDFATGSWSQGPPYPLPAHHVAVAELGGALYAFGGYVTGVPAPTGGGWPATALAFRLDPGAAAWTRIASLPEVRGAAAAAALDGRIAIVGGAAGAAGGGFLASVHFYDPATDSYAAGPDLPTPRDHLNAVTVDGVLYALAGRVFEGGAWDDLPTVEALRGWNGTWERRADAPLGRGGQSAAVLDGRIVLAGGENAEGPFAVYPDVYAYDPATDTWSPLPPLPEARHGHAAAVHDGRMLVLGGALPDNTLAADVVSLGPVPPP